MPGRRHAEARAEKLLVEHQVDELPVPVEVLIGLAGARLVRQRMEQEVSGMTYRTDTESVIGINSTHHPRRQRFTAAHELGHLLLHTGRPLLVDSSIRVSFRDQVSSQATDKEEIEANAFASALLMPVGPLHEQVTELQRRGVRARERLVNELATRFDVSAEAMGYRLLNLGMTTST
jgi:Zn-dependent peptidase ImmA (M78 family)